MMTQVAPQNTATPDSTRPHAAMQQREQLILDPRACARLETDVGIGLLSLVTIPFFSAVFME